MDIRKRNDDFIPIDVRVVEFWGGELHLHNQDFVILACSALATGECRPKLHIYLFNSEENPAFRLSARIRGKGSFSAKLESMTVIFEKGYKHHREICHENGCSWSPVRIPILWHFSL